MSLVEAATYPAPGTKYYFRHTCGGIVDTDLYFSVPLAFDGNLVESVTVTDMYVYQGTTFLKRGDPGNVRITSRWKGGIMLRMESIAGQNGVVTLYPAIGMTIKGGE